MKPRTAPTYTAVTQQALEELKVYGLRQQYKPSMFDVAAYWQEVKRLGLPEGEPDRQTVIVVGEGERAEWKIYVVKQGAIRKAIRMGFAESLGGGTLYLMLLVPVKAMTIAQAVTEVCNRL